MWQIVVFLLMWGLLSALAGFLLGRLFRTPPEP